MKINISIMEFMMDKWEKKTLKENLKKYWSKISQNSKGSRHTHSRPLKDPSQYKLKEAHSETHCNQTVKKPKAKRKS